MRRALAGGALLWATTVAAIEPARFTPADVGLAYPDSQFVRCDPRTGTATNQYVAMLRLEYLHGVIVPKVLRALRDACGATPSSLVAVPRDQLGKFHILYSLRPLCDGQPYAARANYLWDVPQGLLDKLRRCLVQKPVQSIVPEDLLPALRLVVTGGRYLDATALHPTPPLCRPDPTVALDGLLDPDRPVDPLVPAMCAALDHVADVHTRQAHAMLSGDVEQAGLLGRAVRSAQTTVAHLARTPDEAQLVDLMFTGDVDPKSPPERTARLTRQLLASHHEWHAAFRCASDRTPNRVAVWIARLRHFRDHYLRAIDFPGIKVRQVCSQPVRRGTRTDCAPYIGTCLETGDR